MNIVVGEVLCLLNIEEVKDKYELRRFVEFPNKLYQDVPEYIPPLYVDEMSDWDPASNPAFSYCEAKCWLALRDGEIVGRIGAILSRRANEKWGTNRLRFTQVDFIDDMEVSHALFHTVEDWAHERGCDAVHGPLGFTDLDREGMLVDGFKEPGMFITYYNYPYYNKHLERLGYVKDVDWVEYRINIPSPADAVCEKLDRLSERVTRMERLHQEQLRMVENWPSLSAQVFGLINRCYAQLYGTVDLDTAQSERYADKYIPLIRPELSCFVMNEQEEMVAFALSAPSIDNALKRHDGRLLPLGYLDVMNSLRRNDTLDLFLIAVRPDYHDRGVNAILMNHIIHGCHNLGILYAETGPQLEANLRAQNQWLLFNCRSHKRRRCYIKNL